MVEVIIRRAGPRDAQTLANLGLSTFRETFLEGGFAIPYPPGDLAVFEAQRYSREVYAAKLADPRQALWLAAAKGAAVGFAGCGPCGLPHPQSDPADPELYQLYVSRAAQGLGLGRRLLETTLDWMAGFGGGHQWLGVWSGNLKAQRLYAAYGFERVGGYQFPVGRWRDEEFILRRRQADLGPDGGEGEGRGDAP